MASHKEPPQRYWNHFWQVSYAWASFLHVRDACDYIINNQIEPEDKIYYPLVAAICVFYARPFKCSKGIKRLSKQFVPNKFKMLHKLLESMRDQTIAHVDTGSFSFQGLPANNVRVIIRDRRPQLEARGVKFKPEAVGDIRELAEELINRLRKHSSKLVKEYPHDAPQDGEYLIDLTTETLRRVEKAK